MPSGGIADGASNSPRAFDKTDFRAGGTIPLSTPEWDTRRMAETKLGSRARLLAAHFLAKAAQCYQAAEGTTDPKSQRGYIETAKRWELMARQAEAADAAEASIPEIKSIGM